MAFQSFLTRKKWVSRNVKEQFRDLVRELDGQIKEATMRVARANEKGK